MIDLLVHYRWTAAYVAAATVGWAAVQIVQAFRA